MPTDPTLAVRNVRKAVYRWACDYCEAWETFGFANERRPLALATISAKAHAIATGCPSVAVFRIVRYVENPDAD